MTYQTEVSAREVRPGDRVLDHGDEFVVHHAMTTGKKARVTSLAPVLGNPRHYRPEQMLTIERKHA